MDVVEVNLINMEDLRDLFWGKLYLVDNMSLLPNGPAQQVVALVNQDVQDPYTAREKETYLIKYHQNQSLLFEQSGSTIIIKGIHPIESG